MGGRGCLDFESRFEAVRVERYDHPFDTLVQGIELPQVVVGAINRKTEQYSSWPLSLYDIEAFLARMVHSIDPKAEPLSKQQ